MAEIIIPPAQGVPEQSESVDTQMRHSSLRTNLGQGKKLLSYSSPSPSSMESECGAISFLFQSRYLM